MTPLAAERGWVVVPVVQCRLGGLRNSGPTATAFACPICERVSSLGYKPANRGGVVA